MKSLLIPALLSTIAGLSTALGGLLAIVKKDLSSRFMSFSLGFSGGVMIYIAMTELLNDCRTAMTSAYGAKPGAVYAALSFFAGMLLITVIDMLVPEADNPHELSHVNYNNEENFTGKLMRSGILTAIAIFIHNLPEGLTTFSMSAADLSIGLPIVFAVAIHNIPEGIAVAAPVYKATGSRKKAFLLSLLSGIAEPVGGLFGYLLLKDFLTDVFLGCIYGAVAGIMVFITLDELLPLAHEYGEEHTSIYGIISGMAVMAASIIMFM
ncbi:MAG: zinc transporter ZupT [Eubacteriaceae bacterium]|nr:zinc transporter ZupT [Eubacteriaceae bacterium]